MQTKEDDYWPDLTYCIRAPYNRSEIRWSSERGSRAVFRSLRPQDVPTRVRLRHEETERVHHGDRSPGQVSGESRCSRHHHQRFRHLKLPRLPTPQIRPRSWANHNQKEVLTKNILTQLSSIAYSMLLNCNRAVTIRTLLDIPPILINYDRVFTSFPFVVTIWMVVFQKDLWWLLLGLVFLTVATYFQYKSLQVVVVRKGFFL